MGFEIRGLDEMMKKLDDLKNRAAALDGKHRVPFSELFSQDFMTGHSGYASFEELLEAGGYKVKSEEDFKAIPDDEFDKHVSENTDFDSWEEMKKAATAEYVKRRLGL